MLPRLSQGMLRRAPLRRSDSRRLEEKREELRSVHSCSPSALLLLITDHKLQIKEFRSTYVQCSLCALSTPFVVLYRGQFTLKLTLEGRIQRVDKTHNKKHTFGALIHLAQPPQRLKNCTEPAFHYDFMNSIGELMNSIAEFN